MKVTSNTMVSRRRNIFHILIGTLIILLIPLIAMQFTDEVTWGVEDFVAIGVLLLGAGFIHEFIARHIENASHRLVFGLICVAVVLLIWIELAVGILD